MTVPDREKQRRWEGETDRGIALMNEALRRQKFLVRKLFGHWLVFVPDGQHVISENFQCAYCALAYAIESAKKWQWT